MNGPIRGMFVLLLVGCSLVPPEPGAGVYLYRPLEGISPGDLIGLQSERSPAELTAAIKSEPDNPTLLEERGWTSARARKLDAALQDLTAAIELVKQQDATDASPDVLARLHTRRGLVYRASGKKKKAESDFTAAIECEPENWEHYFHRWQIRLEQGDAEAAEQDRQIGLELQERIFQVEYSSKFGAI